MSTIWIIIFLITVSLSNVFIPLIDLFILYLFIIPWSPWPCYLLRTRFDCNSSKWKRSEPGKSKRYQVSFPLWDLCSSPSLSRDPGALLLFFLPQGCGGRWTAWRTVWLWGRRGENWIVIQQSSACGAGKSIILCVRRDPLVRTHSLTIASQAGTCSCGVSSRIST